MRSRGPLQQPHWSLSSGLRAEFVVGQDAIVQTNMRLREEDIDIDTKCYSQLGSSVLARLGTFYSLWVVRKFSRS